MHLLFQTINAGNSVPKRQKLALNVRPYKSVSPAE